MKPKTQFPKTKTLLLGAAFLASLGANIVIAQTGPTTPIGTTAVTDFTVEIYDGDLLETLPYNTSTIRNSDSSLNTSATVTFTVTKPDASTVQFTQKTDSEGRIRGQMYATVLNQVGTYNVSAQVTGGSSASRAFAVKEKFMLAKNGQIVTGQNVLFKNSTNTATAFVVQNAAGQPQFTVDTTNGKVVVTNLEASGTITGNGSALTNINAATLESQNGAYYRNATNINAGTLDNARLNAAVSQLGQTIESSEIADDTLTNADINASANIADSKLATITTAGKVSDSALSSNIALKNAANDFTAAQTVSNAGGKTTLQLSNTGADTGLTVGGDTNLYRSAPDNLKTDDTITIGGTSNQLNFSGNGAVIVQNQAADGNASFVTGRAGEANGKFSIWAAGQVNWGPGGGSDMDTNLYRSSAGVLKTDDLLVATEFITSVANAGTSGYQINIAGDAGYRHLVMGDGKLIWADGSGAVGDTNLYRAAANALKTDDDFLAAGNIRLKDGDATQITLGDTIGGGQPGIVFGNAGGGGDTSLFRNAANELRTDGAFVFGTAGGSTSNPYLSLYIGGNHSRWRVLGDGKQEWSDGTDAADTNLYRSAADVLKTDDAFIVGGATLTLSSNIRGINVAIGNGATTVAVTFGTAHADTNYAVQCTPTYNTTCFVTSKGTGGFTLNFGTAAPDANQKVDWLVVR